MLTKQVIVVRKDLRLRRSEIASIVANASMKFLLEADTSSRNDKLKIDLTEEESSWIAGDSRRIILGAPSEGTLQSIMTRSEAAGLTTCPQYRLSRDPEQKEISGGEFEQLIAVAIGPHEDAQIDPITSRLKLL